MKGWQCIPHASGQRYPEENCQQKAPRHGSTSMQACSRRVSNSSMISSRSSLTAGSRPRENKHMPRRKAHSYGNPKSKGRQLPGVGQVPPGRAEESAPAGVWIAGLRSGEPLWVHSSALGSHQPPGGQTSVQANQTQRDASARQPSIVCI